MQLYYIFNILKYHNYNIIKYFFKNENDKNNDKEEKRIKKKYHGWMHNVKTYQMQVIAFYTNSQYKYRMWTEGE